MAITNPIAVKFSNEKVRVLADSFVTAYETAVAFKAEWDANTLGTLFTDSASEIVADNADQDGRYILSGQKANALYTAATSFITWCDTVVATKTRIAWLRGIAVNGAARF